MNSFSDGGSYPIKTLHQLADYFCELSGSSGVIIVSDNLDDIKSIYPKNRKLYVCAENVNHNKFAANVTIIKMKDIDNKFLADKILICDILNKNPVSPYTRRLRYIYDQAVLSIVSTRKNLLWSSYLFNRLFSSNSGLFGDYAGRLTAVGGKAAKIAHAHYPMLSVLAIIPQYNESDIIIAVINHLLSQGIDAYVIDNWSDDGSFEMVEKLAQKHPGKITVERYPSKPSEKYEWGKILDRISEIAEENIGNYDWAMLNDADELRWSPWNGKSLQQAFSFIDSLGYNSVNHTLFNLVPTQEGFNKNESPNKFFRYGEFPTEGWAFLQIKAWRNEYPVNLSSSGGHHAERPGQRIYPLKFFLAHYPLRSTTQARRKVFKERKPRFTAEERSKGWSSHYDKIDNKYTFIKSEKGLVEYNNKFFTQYLIERISGINIKK